LDSLNLANRYEEEKMRKLRKLMMGTISLIPFLSVMVFGQAPEAIPKTGYGYVFVTPGVLVGDVASSTINLGGGAEGLIKGGL
jgi:uncharacterized membrane protein